MKTQTYKLRWMPLDIRQLDVNGDVVGNTGSIKYSLQTFANQDFTFMAEEEGSSLFDFNSANDNETLIDQTAKGLRIDFSSTLDNGSKLQVTSFLVNEEGLAGDSQGNWTLYPGDFKWNIRFNDWEWHQDAKFLELDIEIKGNYDEPVVETDNNSTFDLGDSTALELRSDYQVLNGDFVNMPDGYPKVTQKSGKTLFTFKFENLGRSFLYDPVIIFGSSDLDSGSTSSAPLAFALLSLLLSLVLSASLIMH